MANVSLLEAAKGNQNDLKAGMIETIIQESPIISKLSWMPISGMALQHTAEDTIAQAAFRNVNEGYTSSSGTDTTHFWGTAILGGEVVIDNYIVKVRGNLVKQKAKQFAKLAKSNAMRFEYEFYNGTGSAASKGFKGVKQLITEGFGQSLVNAANGGSLVLAKLDEAHDLFRNQGGADEILLNRFCRRKITDKARTTVTGVSLIDVGSDVFGKQVISWNGIPLTITGDVQDSSGVISAALPFTEDPGDAVSDCASLYFVKWGEDDICGLLGADGDFDVRDFGEQQAAPSHLGRLEWYPGLAIFNPFSIVRLFGIDQT